MNFTLCKNRCNYTNRNKQPRTPLFPSNPSKTALSLALHHHACLMNAPLALRPCKALGRSTSGIHARPLSKVRCCRPKKFGRLPEGLYSVSTINEIFRTIPLAFRTAIVCVLIWFCICTIPLAFRRVRVCVCFICFASLRNFGHTR